MNRQLPGSAVNCWRSSPNRRRLPADVRQPMVNHDLTVVGGCRRVFYATVALLCTVMCFFGGPQASGANFGLQSKGA